MAKTETPVGGNKEQQSDPEPKDAVPEQVSFQGEEKTILFIWSKVPRLELKGVKAKGIDDLHKVLVFNILCEEVRQQIPDKYHYPS